MHLVCLDVPYPPDYGGAIDMFYKLRALADEGVQIILHCFEYGRGESKELERYCEQVYYYPRKPVIPFRLPYIVSSRQNKLLIGRLMNDRHPVLLEGTHCTYYLQTGALRDRSVWVRMHNIESAYYKNLARSATSLFKKQYFSLESKLLARYESRLLKKSRCLAISRDDEKKLIESGTKRVEYLPLFVESSAVTAVPGKGDYCFFHGNLSVAENEKAVLFILEQVTGPEGLRCIIAGKNPTPRIRQACLQHGAVLIENPDAQQIDGYLRNAQVNILPSMNATGIKVKLVHSLLSGRFVVTNSNGVSGTGLDELCIICDGPDEYRSAAARLMKSEFTIEETVKRKRFMENEFNPHRNAQQLITLLFE